MKKILALFLLLLLSCEKEPPVPTEIYNKYRNSIVLIYNSYYNEIELDNGEKLFYILKDHSPIFFYSEEEAVQNASSSFGTGFFISDRGEIATNRHVIYPSTDEVEVIKSLKAKLIEVKSEIDDEITKKRKDKDEVSDYYNTYYDDLTYENITKLRDEFYALEKEIKELKESLNDLNFDLNKAEYRTVFVHLGIALDDTHVSSLDDFLDCVPIRKASDENIDLAIIQTKNKVTPSTVLEVLSIPYSLQNNTEVKLNDDVYMIGFNHGYSLSKTNLGIKSQFTSGKITQDPDIDRILYSIPTLPGSSGSPIIDKWGNLIGVNYAKTSDFQGFSFGVPVRKLVSLYKNDLPDNTSKTLNTNSVYSEKEFKESSIKTVIDHNQIIKDLVISEIGRDFDQIYSFYSPNIKRYWNLNNPSYAEIKKQYENIWGKTSMSKNDIQKIERISDLVFDMYTKFQFHHDIKNKSYVVLSKVRFIFDSNGKIVEVFGEEFSRKEILDKTSQYELGKKLFSDKTCTTCHQLDAKVIGPSIMTIRNIYEIKGGDIISFLKGESQAIVDTDPGQIAIMKANIDGFVKNLNNDELEAIEAYIKSVK